MSPRPGSRAVGRAQANAYNAQAMVIGPERVALVKVMEQVRDGNIRITPDTLVNGSGDAGGASVLFTAYLATLLAQKGSAGSPARPPAPEATSPSTPSKGGAANTP